MRPQWYCDALPLIVGGDTGASGPVLRNRMLSLLHGIFTQRPGAFAVAFPGREQLAVLPPPLTGALRVFASAAPARLRPYRLPRSAAGHHNNIGAS